MEIDRTRAISSRLQRRKSTGLQLLNERLRDFCGNGPALDATGSTDVNPNHTSLKIDGWAAAIARLEDGIMLQDHRITGTAVAQLTPQTVLKVCTSPAALVSPFQGCADVPVFRAAPDRERDDIARAMAGQILRESVCVRETLTVDAQDQVIGKNARFPCRRLRHQLQHE